MFEPRGTLLKGGAHSGAGTMASPISAILPSFERYVFEPKRLAACAIAFIIGYAVVAALWVGDGFQPVDFTAFWSASWLAIHDDPRTIFDARRMLEAHAIAITGAKEFYHWLYPPTFLLVVLPLALMPYSVSYGVWCLFTFAAYAAALSKFATPKWVVLGLLAFPGTLMNLLTGQNGLFMAALFTAASYTLERRPIVAGVFIGLMSVKPQLGLLWPIVLLLGRHWLAFASACVTTLLLALAATASFGAEIWVDFVTRVLAVQTALDDGGVSWIKIPTLYGGARLLGFGQDAAYLFHFSIAALVVVVTCVIWFRRPPIELGAAVLALAILVATPRVLFYDYALLALPLTLLTLAGLSGGWRPWERPLLILGWLSPLLGLVLAIAAGVQVSPFILLALFVVAAHRSFAADGTAAASSIGRLGSRS